PLYFGLVNELKQKTKHHYALSSKNCSTLIFDHIHTLCKNCMNVADKSIRAILRSDGRLTFWQELLVVDILTSSTADKKLLKLNPITPRYLERLFYDKPKKEVNTGVNFKNIIKILTCLVLIIILAIYVPQVYIKVFFIFTGLTGLVMAVTFFYTDEPLFQSNHQLLWLNPLSLLGLVFHRKKPQCALLLGMTLLLLTALILSIANGHLSIPLVATFSAALTGNVIILKRALKLKEFYHV
ncbi:MAG: hypothetical protein OXH57_09270, partial [Ekhidna sp.]|nr:hypothetical protein [Ekhidna sp.]